MNLIGWLPGQQNNKGKILKDIQKIFFSETIDVMKVKLHIHMFDISLIKLVFLLVLLIHFCCYGSLQFSILTRRNIKKIIFVLSHKGYFDFFYIIVS